MICIFNVSLSTSRDNTNTVRGIFPLTYLLHDDTYYILLKNYAIPYSYYNISSKFENNKLKCYDSDKNNFEELTINDGIHDCDSLNYEMMKYFKSDIDSLPITFTKYPGSVNRICITLKEGWKIDFTDNELRYTLGFGNKFYENNESIKKDFVGEYPAKIEKDVRIILIHCSLIKDSYTIDKNTNVLYKRDVIHSFSLNKSPGSWFTNFLNPRDYYEIHDKELYEIIIEVTDQDNNLIDFNGEKCSFTLEVSKRDLKGVIFIFK